MKRNLRRGQGFKRDVPEHGRLLRRMFIPQLKEKAMGLFTKDIKTLNDLFVHQLQDIYYAEKQLLKAIPKMASKATSPSLKSAFESHLKETEGQVARLERVFEMHGEKPKAADCPAIDGIIKE